MKNLAKVLLYSILISLFALTTPTTVIAGGYGTANVYLEDKGSIDIMGNDGIEFAYSPMTVSRGLASASSKNTIDSANECLILLNSVLFSGHEYYRCSHTQSTDTV